MAKAFAKFCPRLCTVPICNTLPSGHNKSKAIVYKAPANLSQSGLLETTYGTRGMQLPGEDIFAGTLPMILKTVLEAGTPQGSYEVIFQSEWVSSNETLIHVWKFHVSENRQATFIGEEGDELPPLPM